MPGSQLARQSSTRPTDVGNIVFEDCRIVFRNFSGKEGLYNLEGDRNFTLILNQEDAEQMLADGWNIKYLKPREEDEDPQPIVQVTVSYKRRPPRVVLVTSKGKTDLGEEQVSILDWVDIALVDLIINPYSWAVNGKTGIKAYLKTIYVTIQEDELEQRYANVPDSALNSLPNQREIEAGDDPNILDAEIVDD